MKMYKFAPKLFLVLLACNLSLSAHALGKDGREAVCFIACSQASSQTLLKNTVYGEILQMYPERQAGCVFDLPQ